MSRAGGVGEVLGMAFVVATREWVGGYGSGFCEFVLRGADTCWRMGDDGGNFT